MKRKSYFWSHFEEPAIPDTTLVAALEKTQTRQREEQDQRLSVMHVGTRTSTATREEPDQDPRHPGYAALPRMSTAPGTKTLTKSREETDQDISCRGYRVM